MVSSHRGSIIRISRRVIRSGGISAMARARIRRMEVLEVSRFV